jgi:hypothetical protein
MRINQDFFLILQVGPIAEFYRASAHGEDPYFDVKMITESKRPAKVGFKVNSGKPDAVFQKHRGIINTEFIAEKFFQSDMEVVKKTGIINNARLVDIAETNFKIGPKRCHAEPPFLRHGPMLVSTRSQKKIHPELENIFRVDTVFFPMAQCTIV